VCYGNITMGYEHGGLLYKVKCKPCKKQYTKQLTATLKKIQHVDCWCYWCGWWTVHRITKVLDKELIEAIEKKESHEISKRRRS